MKLVQVPETCSYASSLCKGCILAQKLCDSMTERGKGSELSYDTRTNWGLCYPLWCQIEIVISDSAFVGPLRGGVASAS